MGGAIRELFRAQYKPQDAQLGIAVSITLFSGAVLFQASVDDGVTPDNWCGPAATALVSELRPREWQELGGGQDGDRAPVRARVVLRRAQRRRQGPARRRAPPGARPRPFITLALTGAQKLAPELAYAAHGGAFPIRLRGMDFTSPVGVIVVSGLPQEDDHQLVVDACRRVLGSQETSSVRG